MDKALTVLDKTDNLIEQISKYPNLFPPSKKKGVRKAVISKHTSLIYRLVHDRIELLHFWDNRRDPRVLDELLD